MWGDASSKPIKTIRLGFGNRYQVRRHGEQIERVTVGKCDVLDDICSSRPSSHAVLLDRSFKLERKASAKAWGFDPGAALCRQCARFRP